MQNCIKQINQIVEKRFCLRCPSKCHLKIFISPDVTERREITPVSLDQHRSLVH